MQPGQNSNSSSSAIWSAAMSTGMNKPKVKTKKSDTVYNTEFIAPIEFISDSFWKDVFTSCAKNKFPRGFIYSDMVLKHRTSGNAIELSDNPIEFAQMVIYFFQEHGKILSKLDQEWIKKKLENEVIERISPDYHNWSKVAMSKNRRSVHIRNYVDTKYAHLNKSIRDELFTQINIGFSNKLLTKTDVTYINGAISNIEGIDADERGVKILRNVPTQKVKAAKKESSDLIKIYHKEWYKFIDDLQKHIKHGDKSASSAKTEIIE